MERGLKFPFGNRNPDENLHIGRWGLGALACLGAITLALHLPSSDRPHPRQSVPEATIPSNPASATTSSTTPKPDVPGTYSFRTLPPGTSVSSLSTIPGRKPPVIPIGPNLPGATETTAPPDTPSSVPPPETTTITTLPSPETTTSTTIFETTTTEQPGSTTTGVTAPLPTISLP